MKRTLKRELKVREIVKREGIGSSTDAFTNHCPWVYKVRPGGLVYTGSLGAHAALVGQVFQGRVGQHRLAYAGGRKAGGWKVACG